MTAFRFHHVALSVTDLSHAKAFYEKLGFETRVDWRADDGAVAISRMKMGTAQLELFCFTQGRDVSHRPADTLFDDLKRIGTRHFALQVDDLEAAVADLKNQHLLPDDATITSGKTGVRYVFLRDPDGNWVEVLEEL